MKTFAFVAIIAMIAVIGTVCADEVDDGMSIDPAYPILDMVAVNNATDTVVTVKNVGTMPIDIGGLVVVDGNDTIVGRFPNRMVLRTNPSPTGIDAGFTDYKTTLVLDSQVPIGTIVKVKMNLGYIANAVVE